MKAKTKKKAQKCYQLSGFLLWFVAVAIALSVIILIATVCPKFSI